MLYKLIAFDSTHTHTHTHTNTHTHIVPIGYLQGVKDTHCIDEIQVLAREVEFHLCQQGCYRACAVCREKTHHSPAA